MSKDIWHTADEAPKPYEDIAFYVDGYLYSSYYEHNQYGIFGADKVEKWCYAKELSSYILALETELERTRKALEFITRISGAGMSYQDMFIDAHEVAKFALGQVKYPILIGRYDKEMTDLLKGGDNE